MHKQNNKHTKKTKHGKQQHKNKQINITGNKQITYGRIRNIEITHKQTKKQTNKTNKWNNTKQPNKTINI